jgi:elongation factor 1-beta
LSSYAPTQADVVVFKSVSSPPNKTTHPHAARWYSHILTYSTEHPTLPGDATKSVADYVPTLHAQVAQTAPAANPAPAEEEDDDVDLFGSDDEEEDAEAERVKQERLAAYAQKKAAKPKTIAKSLVTLDVKPWDDETDMKALETSVRSIEKDGLVWGSSTFVPVGLSPNTLLFVFVGNN